MPNHSYPLDVTYLWYLPMTPVAWPCLMFGQLPDPGGVHPQGQRTQPGPGAPLEPAEIQRPSDPNVLQKLLSNN